uniref:Uncharacterized protein n=1 Tax=viral metagenome TaxID=1070528 RepID=A0A6C0AP14_9ZZZZ
MEQSRANKISEVVKNIGTLGKNLKIPGAVAASKIVPEPKNAIGVPVQGSGFVRILMYFIAGILLIGIILLGVDQWITPVFQRSPGAPGYIPIPGTDLTQVYWKDLTHVGDIIVGQPPPPAPGQKAPLSVTVLEAQTSYSLTMDVFIDDEYPQTLPPGETLRTFFIMASTPTGQGLQVSLNNTTNTVYVTCIDSAGTQQSLVIDNVPIHTPFRIGFTISPNIMEGYLNGLLVKTKNLTSIPVPPAKSHKIFATPNIKNGGNIPIQLSAGIKVLKIRAFGYPASSSEMKGRMSDLTSTELFNPPSIFVS